MQKESELLYGAPGFAQRQTQQDYLHLETSPGKCVRMVCYIFRLGEWKQFLRQESLFNKYIYNQNASITVTEVRAQRSSRGHAKKEMESINLNLLFMIFMKSI